MHMGVGTHTHIHHMCNTCRYTHKYPTPATHRKTIYKVMAALKLQIMMSITGVVILSYAKLLTYKDQLFQSNSLFPQTCPHSAHMKGIQRLRQLH